MQESAATVKNWGPYPNLTYPLLLDGNLTAWNNYGMGYIPHNVVLDPEMIVRYTTYGYNEQAIIAVIETWLPATGVEEKTTTDNLPATFQLYQNFPNPFNAQTVIKYYLKDETQISITVYNLLGKGIITLINEIKTPGLYTIQWDGKGSNGKDVASGIYIYRMEAGKFTESKKLSLIR